MQLRSLLALPLTLALLAGAALAKEPSYGFGVKPVRTGGLSGKALGAHFMEGVEDYTEYWSHSFLFKSGHVLFARFLVTNLGPGDNKGAVQGHLITPDGDVHTLIDGRREAGSFSYGTGSLSFGLAKHTLSGGGSSFQMRLENDQGTSVAVSWTNAVPGYRPGKLVFGGDKQAFIDFAVSTPRGTAQAAITVGGQTTQAEGFAYADHFFTNYAQHDSCSAWYNIVGSAGEYTFNLTNVVTSKKYGKKRLPFVAIAKGGEIVATSNRIGFSTSAAFRDRKRGYRVPKRYRVTFTDKKNKTKLRATIKVTRNVHRYDIVEGLSPFERFIVERFTKPVQYRFVVSIKLDGKVRGEKVSEEGEGLAEVVNVN